MRRVSLYLSVFILLGGLAYGSVKWTGKGMAESAPPQEEKAGVVLLAEKPSSGEQSEEKPMPLKQKGDVPKQDEGKRSGSQPDMGDSSGSNEIETMDPAAIRELLEGYFAINELAAKYMEEKGYWKENLTEKDVDLEGFYPSVSDLVTRKWLGSLDELMIELNQTYGEGMSPPDFGIRMEIIENAPGKIKIKTLKLPDDLDAGYTPFGLNYYITALNEDGKWLIDDVLQVPVKSEPLDLSWEEAAEHLKANGINAKNIGTAVMEGPVTYSDSWEFVNIPMKVYLIDHQEIKAISAVTGRVILKEQAGD
ncbi:hypothetical protein [Bacillus sp. B-jedd]|uniref:hypothetical protein n=1 Tax=Bacillus sp. B-jedd TaxID=1476857 RepID=UPI000515718D|nr:hypothetical protein [Bacillus sp. B-jedd]CEG28460.1 hypothetical protein BN1002_03378 [Bacillus sp. B-jedd]